MNIVDRYKEEIIYGASRLDSEVEKIKKKIKTRTKASKVMAELIRPLSSTIRLHSKNYLI